MNFTKGRLERACFFDLSVKAKPSSFDFCVLYMYIKAKESEVLMVATLEIPEKLLEEAMVVTKITSKDDVVVFALENLLKTKSIAGLKKFKGKVDLDIDMDSMRGRI
ncbi:type II toxin-antitoxin system VapB family antitoxin [Fibrobacter sp. UWH1]|uniref:type II toxin-antitoxin system VapB family antitoxin n=1 Tax=Fibrobacter sp. UWH1 TaxID=1964354 RepID=UPI001C3D1FCC|nr:type II toxin-antitoxin system VapB family antitoxin [Fibrobacter sp. UWH1]